MRKVVSKSEVAHLWANKAQEEAYTSSRNFSFRNENLYSYSTCIASIKEDGKKYNDKTVILCSVKNYSNTTNEHYRHRYQAIDNLRYRVIQVYSLGYYGDCNLRDSLQYFIDEYNTELKRLQKARTNLHVGQLGSDLRTMKEFVEYFSEELEQAKERASTYDLALTNLLKQFEAICEGHEEHSDYFHAKYQAGYQKAQEQAEKREAKRKERDAELFATWEKRRIEREEKERIEKEKEEKYIAENNIVRLWHNFEKDSEGKEVTEWHINSYVIPNNSKYCLEESYIDYNCLLRYNASKNEIETSLGLSFSLDLCKAMYERIVKEGTFKTASYGLDNFAGHYPIHSFDGKLLIIGCHKIPYFEILYIAGLLNWE